MNVLEIEKLTKKFGDFIAVDHISFSVKEGEIFGFLGPNGAGKSTTIHMIVSLLSVADGTIKLLGKDIAKHRKFAKENIGIVPQELAIYENMSAYENVAFFAGLYGLRGEKLKKSVAKALDFVGLGDKQHVYSEKFSGGMKRRLNIACAIAHQPQLIIMDEPTAGIDPQTRNYILQSVKKLNEAGCTIIYTSHYMGEVEEICSHIAIIDHGKIIAEGTKEQLKSIITEQTQIEIEVRSAEHFRAEKLRDIVGVNTAHMTDDKVIISTAAEVNNMNDIIRTLIREEVEILSVKTTQPDLETVFLTLTGRSLRE
ncbi:MULTISPECIES: ABC transporter ATP-binding protein [Shouchella]|jgi:ABC-2 type transport system ATP-binding protein|uniref:ABC transporter ATP-binding protein n=1 Tax=Shouchella TaxID=2893057 RepID=UPI00090F8517|nr:MULTISPECIES: ABC transporter ATP-binding protein [Shouchella]MBX0320354.1 ABC transporter ATP-binding protein [Shouchella clausii]MDO7282652.1 ABC transporter ATP-binding protein [Shouchella clausii]MDO7302749.1 ABC transporter ATP-binding protein [Shouchella clausii]PAD18654.1 ABC transporter ATP-binding protein [Shouchella clausii]PAD90875.1 ABC transporter ATP-binding protein [Shouchella clausii]